MITQDRLKKILRCCKLTFIAFIGVMFLASVTFVVLASFYFLLTRHESILYLSGTSVVLNVEKSKYKLSNQNGVMLECLIHHKAMRYMSINNQTALIRFVADEKKKENWKISSYSLFEHQNNKYVVSSEAKIKYVSSKSDWCFVVTGINNEDEKDYTVMVYLENLVDSEDALDKRDKELQSVNAKVQQFDLEL